jgi:hypothetical protein
MTNTNQHDRHVEILAEEYNKRSDSFDKQSTIWTIERGAISITCSEALTAMQRAVEEETNHLRQSAQIFLTSYEEAQSEVTTLRTELERVRGAVDIVKNLSEWSLKYPRSRIYPMQRHDKMDGELISIENAAKDFTQQTEGGGMGSLNTNQDVTFICKVVNATVIYYKTRHTPGDEAHSTSLSPSTRH